ncbi:MAG TPA: ATP-binding cassette domain-containing protein [Syntrophorhabdaceae bacterium]|nr:ATP-binding cassette domain-containing protein [Syntrophorhabdaceae bacterium]
MLKVEKLMVFYENALAINELSIHVEEGEIVGIIGSNSAGKTTLVNTLSGLLLDTQLKEKRKGGERITIFGKITFLEKDITNMWADERVKMGIVLSRERHPVFVESDVEENLKIAAYLSSKKEMKENIAFVYKIFPALVPLRKRKAGFLSGGEQQMLAIGMSLMAKPRLLLLDEPLLGLSPSIQVKLIESIVQIRKDAYVTILICEQFARPVLPIIDRGYVLENGMLTLEGTGRELYENPEIKAAYFGV